MMMKLTDAYKLLIVYYILYMVCQLHVSATVVAIVRELCYKECILDFKRPPCPGCCMLSFE